MFLMGPWESTSNKLIGNHPLLGQLELSRIQNEPFGVLDWETLILVAGYGVQCCAWKFGCPSSNDKDKWKFSCRHLLASSLLLSRGFLCCAVERSIRNCSLIY